MQELTSLYTQAEVGKTPTFLRQPTVEEGWLRKSYTDYSHGSWTREKLKSELKILT